MVIFFYYFRCKEKKILGILPICLFVCLFFVHEKKKNNLINFLFCFGEIKKAQMEKNGNEIECNLKLQFTCFVKNMQYFIRQFKCVLVLLLFFACFQLKWDKVREEPIPLLSINRHSKISHETNHANLICNSNDYVYVWYGNKIYNICIRKCC